MSNPVQKSVRLDVQNRPVRASGDANIDSQITDIRRSVDQLWQKVTEMENNVRKILLLVDSNLSTSRLTQLIAKINGHSSAMPDNSGANGDHDQRYVRLSQFNALFDARHVP